jgi:alpha-methylacyl-CoA racemase
VSGPLSGLRIIEFAGIGPLPYAVMLLADMGAEVLRIERAGAYWPDVPIVSRGRASITLDLKKPDDVATARDAIGRADVLAEGFRPGVMERLGLGAAAMTTANPRLIYARMTGWGQAGPRAQSAGHDINYIALSGLLGLLGGGGEVPRPPLNLLGDYAGGSLFLVIGVLAALVERGISGKGQVIDTAIVDGAASLLSPILGMAKAGLLGDDPADSMLSGRAPYYGVYRCSDGRDLSVGPLEAGFRQVLTERLGLAADALDGDPDEGRRILAALLATRPRAEWEALFAGSDACVAPVLSPGEAMADPHLHARGTFGPCDGGMVPMPAPRFSRTPGAIAVEEDGLALLAAWRTRP